MVRGDEDVPCKFAVHMVTADRWGTEGGGGADESGALFFHLGRSNELFYNKRRGGWQPRTGTVSGGVPVRQVNGRSDAPSRGRQIKALDSNASLRM